jgi:hypothetical protein
MSGDDLLRRVNAYVEAAKDEPMVWGESDCTAWPRRWVEAFHGRRMALPAWSSREEAVAHIERAGSLERLWSDALDEYGLFERFHPPRAGDVGIIHTHLAGPVGGIFLNHGLFAWRATPCGVRMLLPREKTIIKVWALQ